MIWTPTVYLMLLLFRFRVCYWLHWHFSCVNDETKSLKLRICDRFRHVSTSAGVVWTLNATHGRCWNFSYVCVNGSIADWWSTLWLILPTSGSTIHTSYWQWLVWLLWHQWRTNNQIHVVTVGELCVTLDNKQQMNYCMPLFVWWA